MKHSFFTKWCGILLILLLALSVWCPLFICSSVSFSNRAMSNVYFIGTKGYDPVVPQPASTEYLIISPNDAWVQSFAEWKNLKGVPTRVANVTWINSNFVGRDLAERIWSFIHNVYTSRSPAALKWVLLIGDNSTLPSRYVYLPDPTNEWTGLSTTLKPTDFYYAVMGDANWDDDSDGLWGECNTYNVGGPSYDEIGDWTPDVYLGRIPFSDQSNITSILNQALTYARNPTSYASTGWNTFLLAGGVSNYDEEVWAWHDSDWTDEAELSDYINDVIIPGNYQRYRYYENRAYFWDYTPLNTFQDLTSTAVSQGINSYSPALINFAAHGSPYDIQRKWDYGYPYGQLNSQLSPVWNTNVTGVAIGDPDNDGTNEFVVTQGIPGSDPPPHNGTVWFHDDPTFGTAAQDLQMIWDLWRNPISLPTWATCVDIGDVWNNGTIAVVVGTAIGEVIIFTYWNNIIWTAFSVLLEYGDPVLCIEVGNADNVDAPPPYAGSHIMNMTQTDIAWGHRSGIVVVATVKGTPPAVLWSSPVGLTGKAVYSIDVGNPNDDGLNEVTFGTGYAGPTGDCNMTQFVPGAPAWSHFVIDANVGGIIYGLDTGDAANDGFNKIVIGCSQGAIYMYEANYFVGIPPTEAGSKRTIVSPGTGTGMIRCLRIGHVDNNDIYSTAAVEQYSIIAGNQNSGIRKYHADNSTGLLDWTHIEREPLMPLHMVTALDVGDLTPTESPANDEVLAGTTPSIGFSSITWYEWPYTNWGNLINATQAISSTANIPALVFADSCLTAAYDYITESLAEAFLRNAAIGYVGSMRVSWYYRGPMTTSFTWGLSRWMNQEFWQVFFGQSTNFRPGATLYVSKTNYIAAFFAAHAQATWETYHRKNLLSFALFGDPEIDVFTDNPRTMTVTYPSNALYSGDTIFRVMDGSTPIAGATICLWDKDGSYYEVQTTNSTGFAILHVSAAVPNTLNVTVTAHNYIPFENTIGVQHWLDISQPTVSYTSATLTLDITGVTATCSNSAHGALDDVEATTHTFTIYDAATDTITTITGDLEWTGSQWQVLDVDASSLPIGAYYVRCTFADSDVSDSMSPPSPDFSISPVTPPPFDFFLWLLQNWVFVLMAIVVVLFICIIILLLRRRKTPSSEAIK